jgi:hypothetical protein
MRGWETGLYATEPIPVFKDGIHFNMANLVLEAMPQIVDTTAD